MKPYELIAALMQLEGLGALPLAKKIGKPKLQPQIHRFVKGEVAEPARTTAAPIANYFNLPIDAIYDEKVATSIAKERGISALPAGLASVAKTASKKTKTAEDREIEQLVAEYKKLSASERKRFRLLMLAARDGIEAPAPSKRTGTVG